MGKQKKAPFRKHRSWTEGFDGLFLGVVWARTNQFMSFKPGERSCLSAKPMNSAKALAQLRFALQWGNAEQSSENSSRTWVELSGGFWQNLWKSWYGLKWIVPACVVKELQLLCWVRATSWSWYWEPEQNLCERSTRLCNHGVPMGEFSPRLSVTGWLVWPSGLGQNCFYFLKTDCLH